VRRTRSAARKTTRDAHVCNVVERVSLTASHRHCRHRCERPLRMDAPSTGWVTALAGLLARGSSPSCARPSRFPSGHMDAGSPLTVAGAATDFHQIADCEPADSVFPLSSPESLGEPAHGNVPSNPRTSQAPPNPVRIRRRGDSFVWSGTALERQLAPEKFLRHYRAARERILAGNYHARHRRHAGAWSKATGSKP
jgi:hypothetical protein